MSYLDGILTRKREEVRERKAKVPRAELTARARDLPPTRSLFDALSPPGGPMQIIAEVKRASPSVGEINRAVDAPALAERYARAGAAAISVLTDGPGFGGSLEDLAAVRARVSVPLLRKDFVVDDYQLDEARAHGADAALLIVAALDDRLLRSLLEACVERGLEALVEVHDAEELDRALAAGARMVGVNNRNLKSFAVDLATSEQLLPRIPQALRGIAESGVKGPAEAERLRASGAANLLVGEALVRAPDPEALLRELRRR